MKNIFLKKVLSLNKFHIIIICILCISILWILFDFSIILNNKRTLPKVKKGVIDLNGWDFERDGTILLDGEWCFYWNQLMKSESFTNRKKKRSLSFMNVPEYWTKKKYPGHGYATYEIVLHSNQPIQKIGIKIEYISTAYKMWINDEEVLFCGVVGKNSKNTSAGIVSLIAFYNTKNSQMQNLHIVLQVSNFVLPRGGIMKSIILGTPKQIQKIYQNNLIVEIFIFSTSLFMGFFFLLLSFSHKKEKYTFCFGTFCIFASFRNLFLGELIIYSIFEKNTELLFSISYVNLTLELLFFVMYYHKMYPYELHPYFIKIIFFTSIGLIFFELIIPFRHALWIISFFNIYVVVILSILFFVTIRVIKKKLEGYVIIAIGSTILLISAADEILADLDIIHGKFYTTKGLFIFILLQCILLIIKYGNLKQISDRFYKAEINSLQAEIKPHFLFNIIENILYLIKNDSQKAYTLLMDLSNYMRNSFNFKNADDYVEFQDEIDHLKSYLNLEKARYSGMVRVIFDINPNIRIKIPAFLIQPIVENALKHGILPQNKEGLIKISSRLEKNKIILKVEDNGMGMTKERLKGLLNEKISGYGIGVRNINRRLKHCYGKTLNIDSIEGKGTTVKIEIPIY